MPSGCPYRCVVVAISKWEPTRTWCCSFLEQKKKCIKTLLIFSYSERPYCWLAKNTFSIISLHIIICLELKRRNKDFRSLIWHFQSHFVIKLQKYFIMKIELFTKIFVSRQTLFTDRFLNFYLFFNNPLLEAILIVQEELKLVKSYLRFYIFPLHVYL